MKPPITTMTKQPQEDRESGERAQGRESSRSVRGSSAVFSFMLVGITLVHIAVFVSACVLFSRRVEELDGKLVAVQKDLDVTRLKVDVVYANSDSHMTSSWNNVRRRLGVSWGHSWEHSFQEDTDNDRGTQHHHSVGKRDVHGSLQSDQAIQSAVRREVGEILKQLSDSTFDLEAEAVREDMRMRIDQWVRALPSENVADDKHKRQATPATAGQELGNIFTELAHKEEEIFARYCANSSILCLPGPKGDIGLKGAPGVAGHIGLPGINGTNGAKGDVGAQGPTGLAGPPGPKGDTGVAGTPGTKGDVGVKGDVGPAGQKGDLGVHGVAGAKGDVGAQGATGLAGPPGPKGDTGVAGTPGTKGDVGVKGDVGAAGQKGDTGVQGAVGAKGEVGAQGPMGLSGPPGPKGADGVQGLRGMKGEVGVKGDVGPVGQKGDQGVNGRDGAKGEVGAQGPMGQSGPPGPKGDDGVQGLRGMKGEVGVKGDVGPAGQKGDLGPQGRDGAKGEVGAQGPMGMSGPPGPKGDDGIAGLPGRKGEVGSKGEMGNTGPQGQQGVAGLKGEPGLRGVDGNVGPKGEQGMAGLSGPPGPKGAMGYSGPPGRIGQKGEPGPAGSAALDNCCSHLSKPKFPEPSTITVIRQGDNATLVCGDLSYPPSTITWQANGLLRRDPRYTVDSQQRLVITGASQIDTGLINCTATNPIGTAEKTFVINVPQHLILAEVPHNLTVVEGSKLTLLCQFDNRPLPTITWYHVAPDGTRTEVTSGVMTGPDGSSVLTREPAQVPDRGTYICVGSNGVETLELTDNVVVESKPYITYTSGVAGVVVANKGDDIILQCKSDSVPTATITWTHDRNDSHVFDLNGDLHLIDIRPEDAGNYSCIATNSYGSTHESVQVLVKVPPEVQMVPEQTPLQTNVFFDCLTNGDQPLTVTWQKDGHPLDMTSGRYIPMPAADHQRLLVTMATDADVGTYTCMATNQHGVASDNTLVYKDMGAVSCADIFSACMTSLCGAQCSVNCVPDTTAQVYGNGTYSEDSSICRSAIHSGVMGQTGTGTVIWRNEAHNAPFPGGITRNGVQSTGAANEPVSATPILVLP